MVKGTSRPERIFTLLGDAAYAVSEEFLAWKAAHDYMLDRYRARDWEAAAPALDEVRRTSGGRISGLYDLYAFRLKRYRAEPPPADWTGVYAGLSHQGKGLAPQILKVSEDFARGANCHTIWLRTLSARVPPLRPFYERFGYELLEITPLPDTFHPQIQCEFIVMEKRLS